MRGAGLVVGEVHRRWFSTAEVWSFTPARRVVILDEHAAVICLRRVEGAATITSRGAQLAVREGDLVVVEPQVPLMLDADDASVSVLWLARDEVARILGAAPAGLSYPSGCVRDPVTRVLMAELLWWLERQAAPDAETVLRALLSEIWHVRGATPAPHRLHPAVGRAVRRIEEELDAPLPVEELADAVGLSAEYLVRLFTQTLGLPPHRYHLHRRLARARALLRSGMKLSDAAQATGFCDQSHLTRAFKRAYGLTPGRYARATLAA